MRKLSSDILSWDCVCVLMHLVDVFVNVCRRLGGCFVFMNLMATGSSQAARLLAMLVITQHSRVLALSKLLTEQAHTGHIHH